MKRSEEVVGDMVIFIDPGSGFGKRFGIGEDMP